MRHGFVSNFRSALPDSAFASADLADCPTASTSQASVSEGSSGISLRELLPTARFFAGDDIRFDAIADSSTRCNEGELIVYRIGQDDPNQLVADALARGAIGILTEQLLPCPLPQCIVGDTEIALAKIAARQLDRPDRKLLTIGVVGSAGKTTTSLLLSALLRSAGYRAAYQTDLGDCDGIVQQTPRRSMPKDSDLVRWIGDCGDAGSQAAIIEVCDDTARHGGYDAIEFDILVIAGGGSAKSDFGPAAIQCALDRMTDDGVVIVPAEDHKTLALIDDVDARALTYSVRKSADITAKIFDQSGGMTTLMVQHQNVTAMMETPLCGAGNAGNHLAATLVGLLLGHPLHEIVEHQSQLREVPGRGQRTVQWGQATTVIDAAGTPARLADALRTERSMKAGGRLWCVLAVGANDTPETLSRYGTWLEKLADHSIITSRSSSKSSFLAASHAVLDGVKDCAALRLVADRRRAIQWAMSEAKPNDTVVIVTGEAYQSAHDQRTDLDQVSCWIDEARPRASDQGPPVTLKLVK